MVDDDENKVVVSEMDSRSNWEVGGIYILQDESSPQNDIAIKVTEVRTTNGGVELKFEEPALHEVIDSIDVEGKEEVYGYFYPEEGVTPQMQTFARAETNGSVPLFQKFNVDKEWEGINFNGTFEVRSLDYELASEETVRGIDKAKVILNCGFTGTVEYSAPLKKEIQLPLGTVQALLPYGIVASGDVSLNFDSEGKVQVSFAVHSGVGGVYEKEEGFTPKVNIDAGLTNVKLEGDMKLYVVVAPEVSFLKIRIIGMEGDFGVGFGGSAEIFDDDPLQMCMDGNVYQYMVLSFVVGPEYAKVYDYEKILKDKDNGTIQQLHIEETGIVEECTRLKGTCQGTVVSSFDNAPIANVKVEAEDSEGSLVKTVMTDDAGKFKITSLDPGQYTLYFSGSDHESKDINVTIEKNDTTEVAVTLEPIEKNDCGITVYVTDQSGRKVSGATIKVILDGSTIKTVTADENGSYSFTSLASGTYMFNVSKSGYMNNSATIEVSDGKTETVEITLQEEVTAAEVGNYQGYVTNAEDQSPIEDVCVVLSRAGATVDIVTTDISGFYQSKDIPVGEYNISFSATGFETKTETVIIKKDITATVSVSLESSKEELGAITGYVKDNQRELVISGATVKAILDGNVVGIAITDSSGYFEITNLKPGSYYLDISAEGYNGLNFGFPLYEGEINHSEIGMNRDQDSIMGTYKGYVKSAYDGTPIAGATLELVWVDSNSVEIEVVDTITTDENGYFEGKPVRVNRQYNVRVKAEGFNELSGSAFVSEEYELDNIELRPNNVEFDLWLLDSETGSTINDRVYVDFDSLAYWWSREHTKVDLYPGDYILKLQSAEKYEDRTVSVTITLDTKDVHVYVTKK